MDQNELLAEAQAAVRATLEQIARLENELAGVQEERGRLRERYNDLWRQLDTSQQLLAFNRSVVAEYEAAENVRP